MGVNDGGKTLHSVTELSQKDAADIGKGRAKDLGIDRPIVVADMSNIAFVFSKAVSLTLSVVNHLGKWASTGMIMVPVCDGKTRPICKQATNQRIARSDKYRIRAFELRVEIRRAKQNLVEERLNESERVALQKEIKKLETRCKSNETRARNPIPKNFAEELERELCDSGAHVEIPSTGGSVGGVVVAEFQADLYMSSQIVLRQAVMVETRDADIPILAGGGEDEDERGCIAIKNFTKGKYGLVGTSESVLKKAMKHLSKDSKAVFTRAECPIFDGVKCNRLRALMMLCLGCDVYLPGMKGIRATKLAAMIQQIDAPSENALYLNLFNRLKIANSMPNGVIDTYIDALLYEPTNLAPDSANTENPARTYLFQPPTCLPKYLEEFAIDEEFKTNHIFPGPEISTCKGVGNYPHKFLSSDGVKNCFKCHDVVCRECHEEIEKAPYCLTCYATESIVPQSGCPSSKSVAEMQQALIDDNC